MANIGAMGVPTLVLIALALCSGRAMARANHHSPSTRVHYGYFRAQGPGTFSLYSSLSALRRSDYDECENMVLRRGLSVDWKVLRRQRVRVTVRTTDVTNANFPVPGEVIVQGWGIALYCNRDPLYITNQIELAPKERAK